MGGEFVKGLVSIIVPVYNVEPYLKECLDSIINQTYQNLEIIVVDNESTDGGGAICDEYAERDSRVKVIHRPHGCVVSYPRNTGLECVTGEYCFFVDSDDWLDLGVVERCVRSFEENPDINLVAFRVPFVSKSQGEDTWERTYCWPQYTEEQVYSGRGVLEAFVGALLLPAPWQRAYRSHLLRDVRFIEQPGIVEDGPFLLELCQKPGLVLLTLPYDGYFYRSFRPGALTTKKAYIWEGSLVGIEQVLAKPSFQSLPLGVKGASVLLLASFLRSYLEDFYTWSKPSSPMTEEEERLYGILLRYQSLIQKYSSYLPWNADGLMARIMARCLPEKVIFYTQWVERAIRVFRLKSSFYVG